MDWTGFTALASSLAINGAMAWRLFRRSNTEAAAGDAATEATRAATEATREGHASAGWQGYADRLTERLDRAEKKADDALDRETRCQVEVARLAQQNGYQAGQIADLLKETAALRAELKTLKTDMTAHGVRADSTEATKPKE